MLGHGDEIMYKKGSENVVDDALCRKFEVDDSLFAMSFLVLCWIEKAHQECRVNDTIIQLIQQIKEDLNPPLEYTWS